MTFKRWAITIFSGLLILCIISGFIFKSDIRIKINNAYDIITTRKVDVEGKVHHLGIENKKSYPVTLVFLEVGCVISQRMIPDLNTIYETAQKNDVKFYGVISNHKATWQEAQQFKKEYGIQFPLLFDSNGDLAKRVKPTVVPESFVFDNKDQLKYHGRINDLFVDLGKINNNPRHNDLLDAVKAVATGQTISNPHQPAKGCIFQAWPKENNEITYNKEIEPIVRANCNGCHRPNDIAPFSLLNYNDVARRGSMIEFVTRKKYMPIWKGEKGYGQFTNEHTLSDHEIKLIGQWVKSDMKEGKKEDLLPQPKLANGEWKLGKPDLILEMEPYNLPASGEDQYRVFVMKGKIPKGKTIRAVDFKPGDPAVVHHSTIFIDYTGKLSKYDKADPKPGYDAFEQGGTMEFGSAVPICGWAPGVGPYSYPDDVGFYVENNAQLAFENHYHLSGKATTDKSYIGIYYADKPVTKYITGSIIGSQQLQITAQESNFKKSIWVYVPNDIELYDLTPHMHYIGKSVTINVQFPDGSIKNLLKLNDWDLRWQSVYTLRELTYIPKGSIIKADFTYDNSDDNANNPFYPAQEMYWGWGSSDEMCEVYFSYIPVNKNDYGKMLASSFSSFDHFYPSNERIDVTDQNLSKIKDLYKTCDVWSNNGQKLLISIIESRKADEIIALMNKEKHKFKNNADFMTNLTELSIAEAFASLDETRMLAEVTKAGDVLYKVLNTSPQHWNANMSYAKIMLTSGIAQYEKEGETSFLKLIEAQEKEKKEHKFSKAYWELGKYYYSKKKDNKAEEILKRGLKYHPDDLDLKQELASDGRIIKKTLN